MRRIAVLFAVLYLTGVSLWGQIPKPAQLGVVSHAEDSSGVVESTPGIAESNDKVYKGPPAPQDPEASVHAPAGTISVEQLQHPVSRKGANLLHRAQNFSDIGDHGRAIAELQLALKERSAIPYADSLLGSEYLRINQIPAAIEALEQAVKLMPRNAVNHSNLGYALFLMGYVERAEQEVRRALDLDRNNEKTRRVLGIITHAGGATHAAANSQ
jgi:tetratricopeptide (TPR) repeat protein